MKTLKQNMLSQASQGAGGKETKEYAAERQQVERDLGSGARNNAPENSTGEQ